MESLLVLALDSIPMGWIWAGALMIALLFALSLVPVALGMRYIPHDCVGVVEKLWSSKGSVGEGELMSLRGAAGYQTDLLRGGMHFFFWPWQYRIHKAPLTVVPQGKIGYVFARDGEPLRPEQTLARAVPSNNFQDARSFLTGDAKHARGQRGRQRSILREGVYAINLALFVVITEDEVYRLSVRHREDAHLFEKWQEQLGRIFGFRPVVVGLGSSVAKSDDDALADPLHQSHAGDTIGIVTVHDGASLDTGQIIAPPVATDPNNPNYHNNFQDVEAFLRAGGRRGRQFITLTDGTYFINRWFATVELIPKTVVPIGHVGVVVSYYGKEGTDVSGTGFRHGERVGEGERGVQAKTLSPGKYAFNRYAGHVYLVPTTNFVLHWITGRSESHTYDESLKSIDLVTADAYEPVLPLSVVVHIDYQKAANVVQRFGDVKKLITQTLDPLLSAYFRDIAHKKTMLQLLHERDVIQGEARKELQNRFAEFDIELVDVLIGKPDTAEASGDIETLLEQLRLRQLSREQIQTYEQQCAAADKLKKLRMAQAHAEKQTELSNSLVDIEIAENHGEAELVRGRKKAEQSIVDAEAEHKRHLLRAEAESRSAAMLGEGESKRVALEGEAHARVLEQKIASFGDPRLYALSVVAQQLANSRQPLVPAHLFVGGGGSNGNGKPTSDLGLLGVLVDLLVADKTGFVTDPTAIKPVAGAAENPRIKSNGPTAAKAT